jgi:hypothetical protein
MTYYWMLRERKGRGESRLSPNFGLEQKWVDGDAIYRQGEGWWRNRLGVGMKIPSAVFMLRVLQMSKLRCQLDKWI